jgi:erythromycin esterase
MSRLRAVILGLLLGNAVACSEDLQGPTDQTPIQDTVPAEIVSWLQANAVPFNTAQAGVDYTDLMPLKGMVGDARVVSLGEATHGTREFFLMKHRVLEFLVKELDFNVFAIEATWPEANRVDDYVYTGQGDPEVLLSGLYFWTWNTEEVLEMILWMREHNQNPGDYPTVSFLGFDMQFPGMAIYNVQVFLQAVDPTAASFASDRYACMVPYANGPTGSSGSQERYGAQTATYRDSCRADLAQVYDSLVPHQAEYEAASSPQEFSKALRSARVVLQYEDMESTRTPGARDLYMAENTIWLLDQAGPDSKVVLWAHNGHVADNPTYGAGASMGHHLRGEYGDDMVIVGFDFYQGEFRAVTALPGGSYGSLAVHSVGVPPRLSYEYYFHSAGLERLILDLRGVDMATTATSWLAGPRKMRSIGAVFAPSNPAVYLYDVSLPSRYDLVIYFDNTRAAIGLPYQPPDVW